MTQKTDAVLRSLITIACLFILSDRSTAADVNGYTAAYECRSGGAHCNVDVAGLAAQACQQTITTATTPTGDWSAITWTNNVICIQTGDHTGRGTLSLASNGTSGTRKVLRCVTAGGDVCSNPVGTTDSNRASIKFLATAGFDFWVIDRIKVEPSGSGTYPVHFHPNSTDIIFNRFLVEGGGADSDIVSVEGGSNHTIQNGVVRNSAAVALNIDHVGISLGNSTTTPTNIRIVNNEIYNIRGHQIQIGTSGNDPKFPGTVVENNDIYVDTDYRTDCAGNMSVSGNCMAAASLLTIKAGGTSANPIQINQNRMWGSRPSDNAQCCDFGGDEGSAINTNADSPTADADYVLFKNNIVMDSQYGVTSGSSGYDRNSFIGNIFYKIAVYKSGIDSLALYTWGANTTEYYLNTFISTTDWIDKTQANADIRCNLAIGSAAARGSTGSGTQIDYNGYYGTPDSGETNKITKTPVTRANSTAYSIGDIIRTTATPPADGTAGDFLYVVTTAGTSAGSPPAYTTSLGATTTDGSMVVRAIRGPGSLKRKLRTNSSGETYIIPYMRTHSSAAEVGFCPNTTGSRTNIGVDNTTGRW